MTREEYLARKKDLTNQLEKLQEVYLEENKPANIGDKVEVDRGKTVELGVIRNFIVCNDGRIDIDAVKLKKDGTPGNHRVYIWNDSKVKFL